MAYHVAIIGGGITGLSAAWYLQQEGRSQGVDVTYSLLEQSDRWGGKIVTETVDDLEQGESFVIEGGPDSFLTQKPWALHLARALGLEEELLPTNDAMRQVFVLHKGRPVPLPDGVLLIVPTRFMPFALSPLLSPLGKLRMGLDLLIPARRDGRDESLADFIQRRLGREALDKIAEPLMSGIYNAEADRQSVLATFPRFRELEAKHGSLIRGMLAARQAHHRPTNNGQSPAGGRPLSMFISLQKGMERLVDHLRSRLDGDCRLNTAVQTITRQADGLYVLSLADGSRLTAAAVVLAVPAYVAARLVRPMAPQAAGDLDEIRYVSTGTLSLAFRREEISHPLDGFGLVIPRSEKRAINAVTWTSTKFEHRAPAGTALLRIFFGGSRRPEMMTKDDEQLLAIARAELKQLMGIDAAPLFHRIYRWFEANPQYDVGHLERVTAIEGALPDGLYVTGSPYRGIGIPDCVHQAQQTAARLVTELVSDRANAVTNG
jgi:protoporphyrinogen/coproporphyrinogen III oxidase